ncbi:hypothetical protein MHK_004776 [Candidatus Magnetomorum sp. HK-1]|nr:hypothetical protein MHK_004776 [Candidatus Magnetomorum sp. HK-1]
MSYSNNKKEIEALVKSLKHVLFIGCFNPERKAPEFYECKSFDDFITQVEPVVYYLKNEGDFTEKRTPPMYKFIVPKDFLNHAKKKYITNAIKERKNIEAGKIVFDETNSLFQTLRENTTKVFSEGRISVSPLSIESKTREFSKQILKDLAYSYQKLRNNFYILIQSLFEANSPIAGDIKRMTSLFSFFCIQMKTTLFTSNKKDRLPAIDEIKKFLDKEAETIIKPMLKEYPIQNLPDALEKLSAKFSKKLKENSQYQYEDMLDDFAESFVQSKISNETISEPTIKKELKECIKKSEWDNGIWNSFKDWYNKNRLFKNFLETAPNAICLFDDITLNVNEQSIEVTRDDIRESCEANFSNNDYMQSFFIQKFTNKTRGTDIDPCITSFILEDKVISKYSKGLGQIIDKLAKKYQDRFIGFNFSVFESINIFIDKIIDIIIDLLQENKQPSMEKIKELFDMHYQELIYSDIISVDFVESVKNKFINNKEKIKIIIQQKQEVKQQQMETQIDVKNGVHSAYIKPEEHLKEISEKKYDDESISTNDDDETSDATSLTEGNVITKYGDDDSTKEIEKDWSDSTGKERLTYLLSKLKEVEQFNSLVQDFQNKLEEASDLVKSYLLPEDYISYINNDETGTINIPDTGGLELLSITASIAWQLGVDTMHPSMRYLFETLYGTEGQNPIWETNVYKPYNWPDDHQTSIQNIEQIVYDNTTETDKNIINQFYIKEDGQFSLNQNEKDIAIDKKQQIMNIINKSSFKSQVKKHIQKTKKDMETSVLQCSKNMLGIDQLLKKGNCLLTALNIPDPEDYEKIKKILSTKITREWKYANWKIDKTPVPSHIVLDSSTWQTNEDKLTFIEKVVFSELCLNHNIPVYLNPDQPSPNVIPEDFSTEHQGNITERIIEGIENTINQVAKNDEYKKRIILVAPDYCIGYLVDKDNVAEVGDFFTIPSIYLFLKSFIDSFNLEFDINDKIIQGSMEPFREIKNIVTVPPETGTKKYKLTNTKLLDGTSMANYFIGLQVWRLIQLNPDIVGCNYGEIDNQEPKEKGKYLKALSNLNNKDYMELFFNKRPDKLFKTLKDTQIVQKQDDDVFEFRNFCKFDDVKALKEEIPHFLKDFFLKS